MPETPHPSPPDLYAALSDLRQTMADSASLANLAKISVTSMARCSGSH
jgi:hypothetical protein